MGQGTKPKNTISMLMVDFQSPGIILWSRHSVGGLSCLGGGLRSLSALVKMCIDINDYIDQKRVKDSIDCQ